MKKLTLVTTILLSDAEEHFLHKYIQANGYKGDFAKELKEKGNAYLKQEQGSISVVTAASIDHVDKVGDQP